jgi:hypothetical protein
MTPEERSISERTAAALEQLKPVAKEVSDAAEALAKPIIAVDAALSRLQIAFEAWVTYRHDTDDDEERYDNWDIGYTRIGKRWGLALRTEKGEFNQPDRAVIERWFFNESPLYLRHRAIDKLPDLIEALAKAGSTVAKKLSSATIKAAEIAETVAPPAIRIPRVKR